MLQEGGKERQPQIAAGDKDLIPVFQKMCDLCTKDVFGEFSKIAGLEVVYDDNELENTLNSENVDTVREDCYLDDVFGASSRL